MVLRFTARVKKREVVVREVVVREVDSPEGALVDVTIEPQDPEEDSELPPEVWETIREGERDIRAGRVIAGDELGDYLHRLSVHGAAGVAGSADDRTRSALGSWPTRAGEASYPTRSRQQPRSSPFTRTSAPRLTAGERSTASCTCAAPDSSSSIVSDLGLRVFSIVALVPEASLAHRR